MPEPIHVTWLGGPEVEALAMTDDEILGAVEGALLAQGRGETVIEPRVHLVPDPAFRGHFNVLRGYIAPLGVAGVKVVGDYVDNYRLGLTSEMALLNLFDPRTGMPRAVPGRISPELQRFVATVRIGSGTVHGPLQVFWLHGAPAIGLPVATLEEARASGDLLITEREQATVPELIVENRGKGHVLLLAGEILLGGKQNRVLTEDLLLPPRSGPRPIGVYCVEQGRWAKRSAGFEAQGSFAAPGLRAKVLEKEGQGRVWAEVDRYARSAAAPSPTGSYQAIYDKPEVKAHLSEAEQALDHRAVPDALGAAVFVADVLVGVDLFSDAALFAREWPKLLRAQAVEAYRRPSEPPADAAKLRARVERLLRMAGAVEGTLRTNAGVGHLFEYRVEAHRGAALVFDGRVIHAAIL